jgi:creatinine amidohydrolase
MTGSVRYVELLPGELKARRAERPIAYLPIGTIEWHGEHAAVGLDGLKAEGFGEAAARFGGFLFPTMWYGEPRAIRHMDLAEDDSPEVRLALGLPPAEALIAADPAAEIVAFQGLVRSALLGVHSMGMQVISVICGHYPLRDWVRPVASAVESEVERLRVIVGCDADLVEPPEGVGQDADFGAAPSGTLAGGDHAAAWETSYLMHLRPDCVDLSVYEGRRDERLPGVIGSDPRTGASRQKGAVAAEAIVAGIVAEATRALASLRSADAR